MSFSHCRFFKDVFEFEPRGRRDDIPDLAHGIYALLKKRGRFFDVVYIGCSATKDSGIWARMRSHDKTKVEWTHFSVFVTHDNISREEIRELEGMFLCIYRKNGQANRLNRQRRHGGLRKITRALPKREAAK